MTEEENAMVTRRCLTEAATAGETGGWRGWGGRESAGGVKVSVAMLCWRCR